VSTNDHRLVREVAKSVGGRATLVKADASKRSSVGVFETEDQVRTELTRSVKAAFDPLRLFNPGRMWDGV
jgi:glycolate oxidase FAD binding subunit